MALDSDLEGFEPNPRLQRPLRHVRPVPRNEPVPPPVIKPPEPASSMTYQQYAVLPPEAQRKVWDQLPPWQQDQFVAAQRSSQPA